MAAQTVSMKALFRRLGADDPTATYIVDQESFNRLSVLSKMDKQEVDTFCKNVRSPGGANAAGGQNRGHRLSYIFQRHMQQAVFYMKTKRRVSRTVAARDIAVANVDTAFLDRQRKEEEEYKNPTDVKVEINRQDWAQTFKTFEHALDTIAGTDGAPLSYCMREKQK